MRQDTVFPRQMRDGEGCRGHHGLAEMLPRICHASVRLVGRVGWAEASGANASVALARIASINSSMDLMKDLMAAPIGGGSTPRVRKFAHPPDGSVSCKLTSSRTMRSAIAGHFVIIRKW
jgi:hypothetical protein